MSNCEIVALVERTAFGEDRGDDVVATKSPDDERFVVVLHPLGRRGAEVESNRSTYEVGMICAFAQHGRRAHARRRVFILVGRVVSGRIEFAWNLSRDRPVPSSFMLVA